MRAKPRADLQGQRFGRLVVTGPPQKVKLAYSYPCVCDCGAERLVAGQALREGRTRSCGCLHREMSVEIARRVGAATRKHGGEGTPEYKAWGMMRYRCYNTRHAAYPRYGGRGIKVCDRWNESFANFLADMGPRPSRRHTVGRIDNDGDYCPENCRWETMAQQRRNCCNTVFYEIEGVRKCLADWVVQYSQNYYRVAGRLRRGWDILQALTTPPLPQGRNRRDTTFYEMDGERLCLKEWAERYNQPYVRVWNRMRKGWDLRAALTTPAIPRSERIKGVPR